MMNNLEIKGNKRTEIGKKATKELRKGDNVPCVLYGGKDTISFSTSIKALKGLIYTDKFLIANLDIDGNKHQAILKDTDFHPVTDKLLHADFQELIAGRKLKSRYPVVMKGQASGVREGGKLELNLRKITVKATPEEMVNEISVDISSLEIGKSLKIRDLDTNLDIINPAGIPIARVIVPRAMRSAAAQEGEGEEGVTEEGAEEGATEGGASEEAAKE